MEGLFSLATRSTLPASSACPSKMLHSLVQLFVAENMIFQKKQIFSHSVLRVRPVLLKQKQSSQSVRWSGFYLLPKTLLT